LLFNSYEFVFAFLPVTLAGYFLIGRIDRHAAAAWLAICSLFFYGWWDARYLALLSGSIGFNFLFGRALVLHAGTARGKRLLTLAVTANLAVLGYYKYADFFIETTSALAGAGWPPLRVVLPLGISFFTFTQIAFLVDAYRGLASEYRFVNYALFVTYFPHLVAGPVLHHKEMMPQFSDPGSYRPRRLNFEVGITIFIIGLAKKVLIADNLATYSSPVFAAAEPLSFLPAWGGVLAYGFQLYFDFSGYSDMAIGLSRLFGVRLPLNFHSPYKAANIIEFWRRWHMTLSRFLRDYLYFPLGGNRKGAMRRHVNLITTMLLGGLWHGAGWNFVIWGGLHGFYLTVNHAWQTMRPNTHNDGRISRAAGIGLTFLAVTVAWVFFRAPDLSTAIRILEAMAGANGFAVPDSLLNRLPFLGLSLRNLGVETYLGGTSRFVFTWGWVVAAGLVTFLAPNTQELLRRYRPALVVLPRVPSRTTWRPTRGWAVAAALLASAVFLSLSAPTEFLYFQF
jgi:D-alanyl-lipoteichoic acid acyltransferase DltB (MBOAT superfamily)